MIQHRAGAVYAQNRLRYGAILCIDNAIESDLKAIAFSFEAWANFLHEIPDRPIGQSHTPGQKNRLAKIAKYPVVGRNNIRRLNALSNATYEVGLSLSHRRCARLADVDDAPSH